jgi:hypothetical protein
MHEINGVDPAYIIPVLIGEIDAVPALPHEGRGVAVRTGCGDPRSGMYFLSSRKAATFDRPSRAAGRRRAIEPYGSLQRQPSSTWRKR